MENAVNELFMLEFKKTHFWIQTKTKLHIIADARRLKVHIAMHRYTVRDPLYVRSTVRDPSNCGKEIGLLAKRIEYILKWNLLETNVKRRFCCGKIKAKGFV